MKIGVVISTEYASSDTCDGKKRTVERDTIFLPGGPVLLWPKDQPTFRAPTPVALGWRVHADAAGDWRVGIDEP